MAVKDKLELERLLSIVEDIERMYKNNEISEETYREMKKNYKDRIKRLQNRIMDLDHETSETISRDIDQMTTEVTENVNEVLKNTMRMLKEQLKTAGMNNPTGEKYEREEKITVPLEGDAPLELKCHVERGKIFVKGSDEPDVEMRVVKSCKSSHRERCEEVLDDIDLNYKVYLRDQTRVIKVSPDMPKGTSVDLYVSIPHTTIPSLEIFTEKGNITLKALDCDMCRLTSENGNIDIKESTSDTVYLNAETGSLSLEDMHVKTKLVLSNENGNIRIVNVTGPELDASTEKGNITTNVSFDRGSLATELGSIKFKVRPSEREQAFKIASELGSIRIVLEEHDLPLRVRATVEKGSITNTTYLSRRAEKHPSYFESDAYAAATNKITLKASTELGTIRIYEE